MQMGTTLTQYLGKQWSSRNFVLRGMYKPVFAMALLALCGACGQTEDQRIKPDEDRFSTTVIVENLGEPMEFDVMKNGNVLIAERKGALKLYDAASDSVRLLTYIPVATKYTNRDGAVSESKHVLTRWEWKGGGLDSSSAKTVLEVPIQREVCCHTGGGMSWDKVGNLYLTVGNNTGNAMMAQTDERPGRESWDDQGHAANTNDLRGKILRIHPENDGSYTIPPGNLFKPGTLRTRPEIYAMGLRNPWRISIDNKTGFVYWGEVGPDANEDTEVGPRGYDEFNQARAAGNFGWPFFVGPNKPFPYYDYEKGKAGEPKDPNHYTNHSPNNNGLQLLPSVAPAFVYYPYRVSEEFPLLGSGARSATGGPVFRWSDFSTKASRVFPAYYEGKWFVTDFSRGWIMTIAIGEDGQYESMEPFLPTYQSVGAIDMKFGPEGDLFVLEYGSNWFRQSPNSRLVMITYNGQNRPPIAKAKAERKGGEVPFDVQLSANDSMDPDGDELSYEWTIKNVATDSVVAMHDIPNPRVQLYAEGVYTAHLEVSDPEGKTGTSTLNLIAGNAEPTVEISLNANRTFFFPGAAIEYEVKVSDVEDGNVGKGIAPRGVGLRIQYASAGFDITEEVLSGPQSDSFHLGRALMAKNNCFSCHSIDQQSIAPSLFEISKHNKYDDGALTSLANKIISGGTGVWGEKMMPANPNISTADSRTIVEYILGITDAHQSTLPTKGTVETFIPEGDDGRGSYFLVAHYRDGAIGDLPSHSVSTVLRLRSAVLAPNEATTLTGAHFSVAGIGGSVILKPKHGTILAYEGIDMTDIRSVKIHAEIIEREGNAGGLVELRIGSAEGELIGSLVITTFTTPELPAIPTLEELMSSEELSEAAALERIEKLKLEQKIATPPPEPLLYIEREIADFADLFFVFKNDEADPTQSLFTLRAIEFNAK